MSKIEYTKKQITELKTNIYVKSCSNKYITFTDDFKVKAIELDNIGIFHRQIFKDSGFPEYIINSDIPVRYLGNWRYIVKNKGIKGLINSKKGRKKEERIDISKMNKDEYIKYLETKLAFFSELEKESKGSYP